MPIHLPPISRRQFLATSLAAGAGLMFPRPLLAAEKPVDEHCWALFSDIHVAADPKTIHYNCNMTDQFKIVSREVLSLDKRPAAVLISGDCAFNHGEEADYAAINGLLLSLRNAQLPVHVTLGNHDVREHFWNTMAADKVTQNSVPDHQVALVETERVNWFILDSLEKVLSTPGLLGEAQIAWLASALDANPGKPAVIVMHHNVVVPGGYERGLKDTDKLLEVIRPRRQVKACIYGHTHNWQIQKDESGIHLINLPAIGYPFNKARSTGWVKADLKKKGIVLELRCTDQKRKDHGQVVDLKWRA